MRKTRQWAMGSGQWVTAVIVFSTAYCLLPIACSAADSAGGTYSDGLLNKRYQDVTKDWGEPHLKEVFQGSTTSYYTPEDWEDIGSRVNNVTDFTARDVYEVVRSSITVRYSLVYAYTQEGYRKPLTLRVASYAVYFKPSVTLGGLVAVFPEFKPAIERVVDASYSEVPNYRTEKSQLRLAVKELSTVSIDGAPGLVYTLTLGRALQAPERPRITDRVTQASVTLSPIYLENRGEYLKDYLERSEEPL